MLSEVGTYDVVEVELKEFPGIKYEGQFRGRIQDVDHVYYNRQGTAIWITTRQGFELMASISDIQSLVIKEKYNV